jgi:hypothetical protein
MMLFSTLEEVCWNEHLQLLHLLYKGLPLCSELAHSILGRPPHLHHEQPFTARHRHTYRLSPSNNYLGAVSISTKLTLQ